jgi:hypothetical protein
MVGSNHGRSRCGTHLRGYDALSFMRDCGDREGMCEEAGEHVLG